MQYPLQLCNKPDANFDGLEIVCTRTAGSPLRVGLSTPTDCVAPLDKGAATACEARLAVNVDKLAELEIITLKEH